MIYIKKITPFFIVPVLLTLLFATGCVSGTDSQAGDYLLIDMIPGYVDGSLSDVIYGSDDYTKKEFVPTDYALYNKQNDTTYYLQDGDTVPNVNLELTLDIEAPAKDVYFIFTNISPSTQTEYPAFDTQSMSARQSAVAGSAASKPGPVLTENAGTRGKTEATEFNRNPYAYLNRMNPVTALLSLVPTSGTPVKDVAGTSKKTFKIDAYTGVDATCRYTGSATVSIGKTKTLNIWVADNCWYIGGTKVKKVNQTMVNAMADKFLTAGLNKNIYDWVTDIYGEEWGEFDSNTKLSKNDREMLIDTTTSNDEITILLFDIDNDNSTSGGVLGYFWAKDNFKQSAISYSNERIMFYLDAVLYATNESTWDITDRWPSEIISTLAHEFQHMIQFYQKTVLRTDGSSGTETWIDEMCSLATEDLVADKLKVNGPRGALYSKAACTSDYGNDDAYPYISLGRLPLFNYFDEYSVTAWYSGVNSLISYSLNYSLGAYLARNYDGADFFSNVVHNQYTDFRAIEYAVQASDPTGDTAFGTMLRRWAASTLLSDKTNTPDDYWYNNGGSSWYTSYASSIGYNLGSINMYKYRYEYSANRYSYGPYIYQQMRTGDMPPASNIYYLAGDSISGSHTWNIKLNKNVRLTVIAR